MSKAKTIMIQGTGSGVGKSVLVSALARIFLEQGYSVAPFKAQNMALNSFVTQDGKEIGRAQATQAFACKIQPSVDMNPVLIKPSSNTKAQIIVHGKPVRNMSVYEYKNYKKTLFAKIKKSFNNLSRQYDVVVIEGAGSPAEVNLKSHDLVNMKIAKLANSPVILVGDIDKGGVFAWLIGTLELLDEEERKLVKGFIINKFRGDKRLLQSGLRFLEQYTGIKVLGVIPYFKDIQIPEEDAIPFDNEGRRMRDEGRKKINIAVICLPHISNFTDFDALENEEDVNLYYVRSKEELKSPDVIILPGTKNTIEDLQWLKKTRISSQILWTMDHGPWITVVGICGGYQMLGQSICDNNNIESNNKIITGLGILPINTQLCQEKMLSQIQAIDISSGIPVYGYEIHHGKSSLNSKTRTKPKFKILSRKNKKINIADGAITADNKCWGTYIHGIFDNDKFRRHFINSIREKKGWQTLSKGTTYNLDKQIEALKDLVKKNIDLDLLNDILK
ncbi:MAG: cobyric acid synthase [Candidatus Omnitrophota bacterium]